MTAPYYQDNSVTIYHGDSGELLPDIITKKVDLIITDPPYSISFDGPKKFTRKQGQGSRTYNFFEGDKNWTETTNMACEIVVKATRCMKENGSIFCWCGHRQLGRLIDGLEIIEFKTRPICWVKDVPIPSPPNAGFDSGFEIGLYAYRSGRTFNAHSKQKSNVVYSDSYRHGQPGKVAHPTQKPFSTIRPFIEIGSYPRETILDPFMGSGTTLLCCKQLGRKAIGIEIEEKYCEIAAKRMSQEVLAL